MESSVCTWNANSLFHQEGAPRSSRRNLIDKLLRSHQVLLLQETHGGLEDFQTRFPQMDARYHIFASEGPNHATGGVAVILHKSVPG